MTVRTTEIVFFDAGETLVHPHPSFPELFARVCAERGKSISASEVAELQARLAPHLVDLSEDTGVDQPSLSPEGSRKFWSFLYRRFLSEFGIEDEELVASLYATFSNAASYALFDDVIPALSTLSTEGYRLGLISNFEGWLDEMLVELEVGDVFDVKVISGIAGIEKPDPAIYELAVDRAGIHPSHAVHVGDSPGLDVQPARAVGMKPVLLDRTGRYPNEDVPTIRSLEDLASLISNL